MYVSVLFLHNATISRFISFCACLCMSVIFMSVCIASLLSCTHHPNAGTDQCLSVTKNCRLHHCRLSPCAKFVGAFKTNERCHGTGIRWKLTSQCGHPALFNVPGYYMVVDCMHGLPNYDLRLLNKHDCCLMCSLSL